MTEDHKLDTDKLFAEVISLFMAHKMNIDLMYWAAGTIFLRLAQAGQVPINKLLSDVELAYQLLPPPIEDHDESNQ